MILPVVQYGDPRLRQKGALITEITPEIQALIGDMFDTMYSSRGIGLAAQQVGHAVQLTVLDIRAVTDRPSTLQIGGKETDPASLMPLVLINPAIKALNDPVPGPEGCLSFPEVYGDVIRPESISVKALDGKGDVIEFTCGGLLARAVQHETDHLHGILFIDRMDKKTKAGLQEDIDLIQADTKARLKKPKDGRK